MTADRDRLVEKMLAAWFDAAYLPLGGRMRAALDALTASGTHWLAPWEATPAMERRMEAMADSQAITLGSTPAHYWEEMRDAYLAEQREDAP